MASFYHCEECGKEFLGPEHIPDTEAGVEPLCERCMPENRFICGICGDYFDPLMLPPIEPGGEPIEGNADFCPTCYAEECVTLEEQIALASSDDVRIEELDDDEYFEETLDDDEYSTDGSVED